MNQNNSREEIINKRVSDSVCEVKSRNGDDEDVEVEMSIETYKLPDLQEIHPPIIKLS